MEHSAGSFFFTIVFYFSVNKRNELDCTIYYGRSSAANILISHLLYIALHCIILSYIMMDWDYCLEIIEMRTTYVLTC